MNTYRRADLAELEAWYQRAHMPPMPKRKPVRDFIVGASIWFVILCVCVTFAVLCAYTLHAVFLAW